MSNVNPLNLPHRFRRLRRWDWSRRMVQEQQLSARDLIWPLFLQEGDGSPTPIPSMPGISRLSLPDLLKAAEQAARLGIPAIALFPYIDPSLRDPWGTEATNPHSLICRACRALKSEVPHIGIMLDVALDPYTTHGHDGILREGEVINDETVERLVTQALVQAQAGADILAPSDMMDGRIQAIRNALEANGYQQTLIMAYAAKYASAFYGPFREAVGTQSTLVGDKRTYQLDPANAEEALHEVEADIEEGADMVMIKPGLPYLDIIWRVRHRFQRPTFAYQVSGEYAMIEAAVQQGWLDRNRAVEESLLAFKRAGCTGILTYYAMHMAQRLAQDRM